MGEQGGWPLTMFLAPDGVPFWGGTYFPPQPARPPRLPRSARAPSTSSTREGSPGSARNAEAISAHLQRSLAAANAAARPTLADLDQVSQRLAVGHGPGEWRHRRRAEIPERVDLGGALARLAARPAITACGDAALAWIRALCNGGIYDHLGGGIHRYTVDARWLVPHFEKMLYDNAQFVRALCICFAATSDELFGNGSEETIDFLLTDMRSGEGAFCSSFDADSEGEEGRFYVWSRDEIRSVLGDVRRSSRASTT